MSSLDCNPCNAEEELVNCDPCDAEEELVAAGLLPPPGGQAAPCPPILLSVFLQGALFPFPALSIQLKVLNTPIPVIPNPFDIVNAPTLVVFLNTFVLPAIIAAGISVQGSFVLMANGMLQVPRIAGECSQLIAPFIGLLTAPVGLTMLVPAGVAVQPGHIVAPAGFSSPPAGLKKTAPVVSEVIADLAKAATFAGPVDPSRAQQADGWAVVKAVQRKAVPDFDRVLLYAPGDVFTLQQLDGSPLQDAWAAVRDPVKGDPSGAYVGMKAGEPSVGPAIYFSSPPGTSVVTPRVAMPVDVLMADGSVQPGFRLVSTSPAATPLLAQLEEVSTGRPG